jgi:hypothetical protein
MTFLRYNEQLRVVLNFCFVFLFFQFTFYNLI